MSDTKILTANANFIPGSPGQLLDPELSAIRWGMDELQAHTTDYGYDGIELHWVKAARHCRELDAAGAKEAQVIGQTILSLHEGWRGTANPQPLDATLPRRALTERGSLAVRLGSMLLLPTGEASLDRLEETEAKLGRATPMHYVLFPDEQGRVAVDQAKTRRFPNSSIQPTADVAAAWGATTAEDFVYQLRQRGYQATIDSFHISRLGRVVNATLPWEELTELLLAQNLVPEVHVSVGRVDFANIDPARYQQSVEELRALATDGSLEGTPLGRLFELLNKYQWAGNVVVEATLPGLAATFGRLTPGLVRSIHQSIVANIRRQLPAS